MDYKGIIKSYMKMNRVTYQDLASQLGMSKQAVWHALNGKKSNNPDAPEGSRAVSQDLIDRMLEALGLEIRVGVKQ